MNAMTPIMVEDHPVLDEILMMGPTRLRQMVAELEQNPGFSSESAVRLLQLLRERADAFDAAGLI